MRLPSFLRGGYSLGGSTLLRCSGWLMGYRVKRPHPQFFMVFGFLYVARIPVSINIFSTRHKCDRLMKKNTFPLNIHITVWVSHLGLGIQR